MNSKQRTRDRFNTVFQKAYHQLNVEQRQAVDHIDGSVMVIAGPGTGKTQILAVRIGKILLDTDTQAHNILCLTYTDAATIAMRERLVEIIGSDAHRVNIFSFHAFCNQVIQDNLGYFGDYRQLEPITELEQVDLYKNLIKDLPNDHILKRLKSDSNYEAGRLAHLFSLMKKENYKVEDIFQAIELHLSQLKDDETMYYKRSGKGYTKGEFKQKAYDEVIRKMNELDAGAKLFPVFQEAMLQLNRYDYNDMITWVIRAFEEDADLLADYQERYHYFLVDEFQDTNGSQKRILDLLVSFWGDEPNAFVVGDDDQAIYKFQGANIDNITDFKDQYKPTPIVLTQNYRSSQKILDAAMVLIDHNVERIVKREDFPLNKDLIAQGENKDLPRGVVIRSYPNLTHEQAHVANQILQKHSQGEDLSKLAILYRKHKQIDKLVEVLEKKGVPLNIRKKVDILKLPIIRNTLNVMRYINDRYLNRSSTDRMLFELMHYNFFEIRPSDISNLVWYVRTQQRSSDEETSEINLSSLISDEKALNSISLFDSDKIVSLSDRLNKWIADINDVTLQNLFQHIINEGQILSHVLRHPNKTWLLQVLGTLFDLIKEETSKQPDIKLNDLLHTIDLMIENSIPLQVNKVVQSDDGVHFTTVHSAKGMEYEEVIVIGCTKNVWDRGRGSYGVFSYPPTFNGDVKTNQEDERRLMYVAMTRAEKALDLSYSLRREDGKELGVSQFVDEVRLNSELELSQQIVAKDLIDDFQQYVLTQAHTPTQLIEHDLIDKRLKGYQLSVTHLNKYLKCPITYYFEVMLRVPMARTKYLGFGRATHYGLEMLFRSINEEKNANKEILILEFQKSMKFYKSHFTDQEYKDMAAYGNQVLSAYYTKYKSTIDLNIKYELEAKIDHVEYEGIPIKGVLDRVAIYKDHIIVTDFKTGNVQRNKSKLQGPSDKYPEGGDYWRQMVFYKLLCDIDVKHNWNMRSGIMDFIEPDRKSKEFFRQAFEVLPEEMKIVGEQIKDTWKRIHNHEFKRGCGEEDCFWCNFVQNDYVMDMNWEDEDQ